MSHVKWFECLIVYKSYHICVISVYILALITSWIMHLRANSPWFSIILQLKNYHDHLISPPWTWLKSWMKISWYIKGISLIYRVSELMKMILCREISIRRYIEKNLQKSSIFRIILAWSKCDSSSQRASATINAKKWALSFAVKGIRTP